VITSKVLNKSLGLKRSCPKLKRSSTKTLSELLNQEGLLCLRSVTTDRLSRFSGLAAVKRTPPICSRRSAARPVEPRRCHCAGGVDDGSCDHGDFMQLERRILGAVSTTSPIERWFVERC
jgi:hypothetical protein